GLEQGVLRYDRIDPTSEAHVDELLGRMTLAEKVGQLVQVTPFLMPDPADLMEQTKRAEEAGQPAELTLQLRPDLEDRIRMGGIGSIFGSPDVRLVNHCQRLA